ncbi:MAG: cysteine hydrolase family protein [Candidatus Planktophila sp.]
MSDKSALLVIDVQNGVVVNAWQKDSVVRQINSAIDSARSAQIPVIWVQHSEEEMPIGSDFWQIIPELVPQDGDSRIEKIYGSSFKETNLADVLAREGVQHLYITGAQSENCVNATTVDALERGYKVTLISDAHTTDDAGVVATINGKFVESGTCGHNVEVKSLAATLPLI